jgi:hypothetical protein
MWTSEGTGNNPYISITAHYVNSPVDKPDQWELREDQLALVLLEGHHTRANIALIIISILNKYSISQKVCLYSCHIQMLTSAHCL